jgi:signal transduction histidine kinase
MLATELSSHPFSEADQAALIECVQTNRADLISRCRAALRQSVFINRIDFHPGSEIAIAERQPDVLINFLGSVPSGAREQGAALCNAGLNSRSFLNLNQAMWDFFLHYFGRTLFAGDLIGLYANLVIEGFIAERENMIRREQENIRTAFEIALKRSNDEIQEIQNQVQIATELNYRRVIMAQEEERRRISRELHDEAGQALIGIRLSLENLSSDLPDFPDDKQERIEKAIYWTEHALHEIRTLAYSLRPPMLDLLGIHLTIKQLCIEFARQTGLVIRYAGEEFPRLNDELAISLYRFVQEALANVAKHARAKHVWVKLKQGKLGIELSILDDGEGFDPHTTPAGIGLNGMEERIHLLKGNMEIKSAPEKSTLLVFYLPLILKTA